MQSCLTQFSILPIHGVVPPDLSGSDGDQENSAEETSGAVDAAGWVWGGDGGDTAELFSRILHSHLQFLYISTAQIHTQLLVGV